MLNQLRTLNLSPQSPRGSITKAAPRSGAVLVVSLPRCFPAWRLLNTRGLQDKVRFHCTLNQQFGAAGACSKGAHAPTCSQRARQSTRPSARAYPAGSPHASRTPPHTPRARSSEAGCHACSAMAQSAERLHAEAPTAHGLWWEHDGKRARATAHAIICRKAHARTATELLLLTCTRAGCLQCRSPPAPPAPHAAWPAAAAAAASQLASGVQSFWVVF